MMAMNEMMKSAMEPQWRKCEAKESGTATRSTFTYDPPKKFFIDCRSEGASGYFKDRGQRNSSQFGVEMDAWVTMDQVESQEENQSW
jgi:hypothetical protein